MPKSVNAPPDPPKTSEPAARTRRDIDLSAYSIKAFLDTNIVLEGKDIGDLPWDEIDPVGPIIALITSKAMQEIDSKKGDGRLGPRARAFNRLFAPAILTGAAITIRETGPRVELAASSSTPIPWQAYDELDPGDADAHIVAEVLHARDVADHEKLLISHDLKPLGLAAGRGLRVHHVSDDWLRPSEPSPADKQVQRLKGRVRELEASEPEFDIQIAVDSDQPAALLRVEDLGELEREDLLRQLVAEHPKPAQASGPFGMDMHRDYGFDDRWKIYRSRTLPEFAASYARKMEAMYNQRPITISVRNSGLLQANDLVIEVSLSDGWLNRKIVFFSPAGPPAPEPRGMFDGMVTARDLISSAVGRHEFQWIERPKRSGRMATACAAFSHEQQWAFRGVICLDARVEGPSTIEVKVRASNLHGAAVSTLSVEKTVETVAPFSIIDQATLRPSRKAQIFSGFESVNEKVWERIEIDGAGSD